MKRIELSAVRTSYGVVGKILGVFAFTILMSFSALVKIPLPFTPVPITLQNLVVFLAGAFLGPVLGAASVGLYIGIGLLGVPLFANMGFGLLYLGGPTGGYLCGFFVAAWLIGYLVQRLKPKGIFVLFGVMVAGALAIYCVGGLWLRIGYGWGLKNILFLGVAPFFLPDLLKAFLAAVIYKSLQ